MKLFKIIFILALMGSFSLSRSLDAQEQETEESFVAAVEAELQDSRYQTTLPEPLETENFLQNFHIPDWVGPILNAIFWIMLFLLGVFLIYQLVRYWNERTLAPKQQKKKNIKPVRVLQKGRGTVYIPTLEEAEKKARDGHYSEAIHLLLLIALHEVFGFINIPVPKAKTSREILGDGLIFDNWGEDLGLLVRAVEEALFAGKKQGQTQYRTCRKTFDRLAGSLRKT
ncbi:MAG: hypothetical protein IIB64_04060 [Proteobacteria bacterium]|nr:hypothetical protein [Pseudomonadota bacterium]